MTTTTVKDVLIAARAKISDPARWTRGSSAKTKHGSLTYSKDSAAVCWCAAGAVVSAVEDSNSPEADAALRSLRISMNGPIPLFNDTHTHAEVLAKFDEAIAAQGGE